MIGEAAIPLAIQRRPAKSRVIDWRAMWLGHPSYWLCQFIGWFGGATGEIVASVLHSERTAFSAWFNLVGACLGVLISHLMRAVIWRQGWFEWSSGKQLLWSVVMCIPAALLYGAMFFPMVWGFDPYKVKPADVQAVAFATLFWSYSALVVWCGFYFGWHYLRN